VDSLVSAARKPAARKNGKEFPVGILFDREPRKTFACELWVYNLKEGRTAGR
jgi:hypothetical protein